jgi:hypothetical protein
MISKRQKFGYCAPIRLGARSNNQIFGCSPIVVNSTREHRLSTKYVTPIVTRQPVFLLAYPPSITDNSLKLLGDPGRIRTCDLQLRRLLLYPLSYGAVPSRLYRILS